MRQMMCCAVKHLLLEALEPGACCYFFFCFLFSNTQPREVKHVQTHPPVCLVQQNGGGV